MGNTLAYLLFQKIWARFIITQVQVHPVTVITSIATKRATTVIQAVSDFDPSNPLSGLPVLLRDDVIDT